MDPGLTCLVSQCSLTHMGRDAHFVILSSKGQIVIPATLRRRLDLKSGSPLVVRRQGEREIVLCPLEDAHGDLDTALKRIREAVKRSGRDPLAEFHEARRREREEEKRKHERWRS